MSGVYCLQVLSELLCIVSTVICWYYFGAVALAGMVLASGVDDYALWALVVSATGITTRQRY